MFVIAAIVAAAVPIGLGLWWVYLVTHPNFGMRMMREFSRK